MNAADETLTSADPLLMPATDVLEHFRAKTISPVEYLSATLDRIDDLNPGCMAMVDVYADEARSLAVGSERRYQVGRPMGPLDGLPVAIKDETPVAGHRTTRGSLLTGTTVDAADAVVVSRIREAGGIVHARTATSEFCCAPFTHSLRWGVTTNPWNPEYSPGGSSGGAGAALALGMTPLADGSDFGGSLRIPAAFCGVVGYKPPYGRVPGVPPGNLDTYCHQGPMARTVQDCALLQDVISGPSPLDPTTVPGRSLVQHVGNDIRDWRFALSLDCGGFPVSEEVISALRDAAAVLVELGATVTEVPVEWTFQQVQEAARIHAGVTFGAEFEELVATHPDQLTRYVQKAAQRAASVSRGDYPRGLRLEADIQRGMAQLFQEHDILLCPTVTTTGLFAGEDYVDEGPTVDGVPTTKHRDVLATLIFNICSRNPAISVPIGFAANGVPIGMQIAAPPFQDEAAFTAAFAWQGARSWPLALGRGTTVGATATQTPLFHQST